MKVLQINIFGNLSTGRIAVDLYRTLKDYGHEGVVAFSRNTIEEDVPHIQFGTKESVYLDGVLTRITDRAGFYSKKPTEILIKKIKDYNPDIIHLHNLHGYYINVELLFNYLKDSNKPVVWTLHDCWSFTGHCCNFESINCEKWKTRCHDCQQKSSYPASWFVDKSSENYLKKKLLFNNLDNLTLVTPSCWLKLLVEDSFLSNHRVEVIHNGVDLKVFKPVYGNWVKHNELENKKIVLGVAGTWSPTKGLTDMVKLSEILPEDYQVVVVGVSKKQKSELPKKILAIERTYDVNELVEIYSAAKVFINPTYEDNFPNVNLESLACGTPVITYKTGGSPEAIDEGCGAVVARGDIYGLYDAIKNNPMNRNACIERAKNYSKEKAGLKYIELYNELLGRVGHGNN